jgi:hypothetical protein
MVKQYLKVSFYWLLVQRGIKLRDFAHKVDCVTEVPEVRNNAYQSAYILSCKSRSPDAGPWEPTFLIPLQMDSNCVFITLKEPPIAAQILLCSFKFTICLFNLWQNYITFTQEICNKNVHAWQCLSSLFGCGLTLRTALVPQEVSFLVLWEGIWRGSWCFIMISSTTQWTVLLVMGHPIDLKRNKNSHL